MVDDSLLLEEIIELRQEEDCTFPEISEVLNSKYAVDLSADAVRGRFRRWRIKNQDSQDQSSESSKPRSTSSRNFSPLEHKPPKIEVADKPGPSRVNADDLWDHALGWQSRRNRPRRQSSHPRICLPDEPVAIAFLSDLHIGAPGTDYHAIRRDAEIVAQTPGMYAVFHGDGIDNWIIGKLKSQQRKQILRYDEEVALFMAWLKTLGDKLQVVVAGNHDNWTFKVSGIDLFQHALDKTCVLYDPNEIVFDLEHGPDTWTVKVRHKWKGHSVFNPTHSIEVGWQRGDIDFDIGVAGHTHIGTYFRPFHRHGKKRYAVLTGTYKVDDEYARERGFPGSNQLGCGALVLYDGRMASFDCLEVAADFLEYLRKRDVHERSPRHLSRSRGY